MTAVAAIATAVVVEWKRWGYRFSYFTGCSSCGEFKPCRGMWRRRMLCLTCFDEGKR